jgi:hypothetical protein
MKKITLILASAALASTAFAISPKSVKADAPAIPQQMMQMEKVAPVFNARMDKGISEASSTIFRANSYTDTDTIQVYNNTSRNMLYSGMTSTGSFYAGAVGIGGYKGETTFQSLNSDYSAWCVAAANSTGANVAGNYTGSTLTIPNGLVQNYYAPMMINGTDTLTNNGALFGYSFGLGADWWGYTTTPGLGTCPTPWAYQGYWMCTVGAMTKDATGTDPYGRFDSAGTYTGWYEVFDSTVTNIQTIAAGQIFPKTTTPYVVTQYWTYADITTTAETQLEVFIYPIVDGVMSQSPIAKGTAIVDAPDGTEDPIVFDLVAVDEDGDEVDGVISISEKVAVIVYIDSESISSFYPVFYNSTVYPKGQLDSYFDNHALVGLSYTDADGQQQTGFYPCPYTYGSNKEGYSYYPTDAWGVFDAAFPYVYNAVTSTNGFDYDFNITLDDDNYGYAIADSYYDIVEMIEAGYMEASSDDDWFEYNISSYEESGYTFTAIEVQAEALPEGTEGRAGTITITGAGQDFTVTVIQGQVAGLSNVTVANNSASEYFDLQGRQLKAAPANGVYLQRQGNKVSKVIR